MFDKNLLQEQIIDYKNNFLPKWWKDEKYKWEAVKTFQENWDINANDFVDMLKRSFAKTGNLLASGHRFPRGRNIEFASKDKEEVRKMFENLFDENRDVIERILEYKEQAKSFNATMNDGKSHFQDENAITTYLWLRYPDKYYIFKSSVVKALKDVINYDFLIKDGGYENNFKCFYPLYDEICDIISNDNELTDFVKKQITDNCYHDPKYKTLTMDLCYYMAMNAPKTKYTHWWFNTDAHFLTKFPIGEKESFSLYTEKGNYRHYHNNFINVNVGDILIGYEAGNVNKIVSLCQITGKDENNIFFKKIEDLQTPIHYTEFVHSTELSQMQGYPYFSGSLLRLTNDEFDFIIKLICEKNPDIDIKKFKENNNSDEKVEQNSSNTKTYNKDKFLSEVFMSVQQYDKLVAVLKNKKNIILQGAPGVGKTFAAKRLAYSIIGECDKDRIEFVQFHQNYSYEDFMMGYKPSDNGFELKYGIFYNFCKKAENDKQKDYFFIIDEINRGNMSKIFGELLMMIEKDYRGTETTLAYNSSKFTVPENLYIIGMMNTADRSLAMIDYALRRRFSFFEISPAFDSDGFKKYQNYLDNNIFNQLIEKIKELNETIKKDDSLGKGFCIGHSYFCNLKKEECTLDRMQQVVEFDILPMLEEYWFDDNQKVENWSNALHTIVK
ncbi:MAG: AAA family ATPase [Prevotella sp.]|nr:AAA family ATPase [Prevotella sp.]